MTHREAIDILERLYTLYNLKPHQIDAIALAVDALEEMEELDDYEESRADTLLDAEKEGDNYKEKK